MYPPNTYTKLVQSYLSVFILFWLVASGMVFYLGYHQSFLLLNQYHTPYLDNVIPHLTQLGDSLILSSLVLMFLSFRQQALAFTIVLSIITSGLLLLSLKYLVFTDWHRPLKVLGEQAGIHFVKGHVEYYNAFPSGHTTTIFSAFLLIAMLFKDSLLQFFIGVAAIVFSYTRIYLAAHFLGDVLAGSILGTVVAMASLHFIYPWVQGQLDKKEDRSKKRISLISSVIGLLAFVIGISVRYVF